MSDNVEVEVGGAGIDDVDVEVSSVGHVGVPVGHRGSNWPCRLPATYTRVA